MRLVRRTVESIPPARPRPTRRRPQGMCMDKGYDYADAREAPARHGFTPHVRGRGEEAWAARHKAGAKPRRWVVERTHRWFNRNRRALVRWEKKPENYEALLHFVCGIIAFRSAGLFG